MNSGKSYMVSCDRDEVKLAISKGLKVNYIGSDSGYAAIEILNEKPKIKMTKTLPGEVGLYYWSEGVGHEVSIIDVWLCGSLLANEGGYWAKVDESMFEFEGE